jgi:tetratricopeptide (TPR) repeat protein
MRRLLLISLSLLVFSAGAIAAGQSVWQKNEAAIVLLKQQQYDAALELFLQAEAELPGNEVLRHNIAMAYLGAGQEQVHAGDFSRAAELLQQGKEYNQQDSQLWLLRGVALLKNGRFDEAEGELNEAWAMRGDEPAVLQQLGQLYYASGRMDEAIDSWQRALDLDPQNQHLGELLKKTQRELAVENELERNYSGHFILSYADNGKADIGGEILDTLESAYTWAGAKLGHYPARQTPVILYTQRQFRGLTGSPEWAAGLYDGKIRLAIGGLTHVSAGVRALLAHEFMHVMVYEMAGNNVPFWLNEGLAELAARQQHDPGLPHLLAANEAGQLFPLAKLQAEFRHLTPAQAGLAYEQSYSFVAYLIERFGWYQMAELLSAIKAQLTPAAAIIQAYGGYGVDMAILERDWRQQL